MSTPSLLEYLVATAPEEPEHPVAEIVESHGRGHLALSTHLAADDGTETGRLLVLDLGGYMQISSGTADLTPEQAARVGAHLIAWAERSAR